MISKFNDYLILEKTNFNKFNFTQKELEQIFKDVYSIPTKFKTKKLKIEDLYNEKSYLSDNHKSINIDKVLVDHKNAILIISKEIKILLFFNYKDKNSNKYHIIDFYVKNAYNITYDHDLFKMFFIHLNDKTEIYKIEFNQDIEYKKIEYDHFKVFDKIEKYCKFLYNDTFEKYYKELYTRLVSLKNDMNNNKNFDVRYYQEIHGDINRVFNLKKDMLYYMIENKESYSSIIFSLINKYVKDVNILKKDKLDNEYYESLYKLSNLLAITIFKLNRSNLNYTNYENLDRKIEKDITSFNDIKDKIYDPKLKAKYKHLYDAGNFDLF